MEQNANIVLCGFMGCGKTTIGKLLAKNTGWPFIDMDHYIEQNAHMSISEIFAKYGEAYFRDLEHAAVKQLAKKNGCIISAGGGTLVYERNVQLLRQTCRIVLLDVPLPVIRYRLRNDTKRPLLQRPDKDRAMQKLYCQRMPLYRAAAQYTVAASKSPYNTVKAVMEAVGL